MIFDGLSPFEKRQMLEQEAKDAFKKASQNISQERAQLIQHALEVRKAHEHLASYLKDDIKQEILVQYMQELVKKDRK